MNNQTTRKTQKGKHLTVQKRKMSTWGLSGTKQESISQDSTQVKVRVRIPRGDTLQ